MKYHGDECIIISFLTCILRQTYLDQTKEKETDTELGDQGRVEKYKILVGKPER
jgi:hypothetical protein